MSAPHPKPVARKIILEFWRYEITNVSLPSDIWIHYTRGSAGYATRVSPSSALQEEAIKEASILSELLGLDLEVKETILELPEEQKRLVESGEAQ
jgi:hypothetical protein